MAQEDKRERTMSTRRKKVLREEFITRERMAARMTGKTPATSDGGGRRFGVNQLRREGE
jgi:hypothetical protein